MPSNRDSIDALHHRWNQHQQQPRRQPDPVDDVVGLVCHHKLVLQMIKLVIFVMGNTIFTKFVEEGEADIRNGGSGELKYRPARQQTNVSA